MIKDEGLRFDGISVVVPFYQNENSVLGLHKQLVTTLTSIGADFEMIYVNDGSRDTTADKLREVWEQDDRVTVLNFARNFGQRVAWTAGLSEARGNIVVTIDGDGQLDPADIPKLLEPLRKGLDVVSGWRVKRQDPIFRKLGSRLANWSVRKLGRIKVKDFGCSLRSYRGDFLDQVDFGPHRLYDKAEALSLTDAVVNVPVSHLPPSGSGWALINLVRYWVDILVTFGDQFFFRVGLWAASSLCFTAIAMVIVLLGIDLAAFAVPLILLLFSILMGLLSLIGMAAFKSIRAAQGQTCYVIKTRLSRRQSYGGE